MAEQCAECGNTYRSQLAWKAEVAQTDLEQLSYGQREPFLDALSEVVQAVCEEFGLVVA
jgi:hypothetical protein